MSVRELSGSILKDPVCGMEVTPGSLFRAIYKGQDYTFCSLQCLTAFKENPEKYLAPLLFLDPVCCKSVPTNGEFRTSYNGHEYIFCSERCLVRFQESPGKFIVATVEYFKCPRHPGVRQAEPGECPHCGMPLAVARSKWVCPHHPQVLQDLMGPMKSDELSQATRNCPRCGMEIEPSKVPGGKAKEHEEGCPKCGLVFPHE
jgi:YHS domain-containing protein/ribosomal protein S27AE